MPPNIPPPLTPITPHSLIDKANPNALLFAKCSAVQRPTRQTYLTTMTCPTWQTRGQAKCQAILNAIPEKWRLKHPVPPATELRDVTGDYIQQFLTEREIEITEKDAVDIVAQTSTGRWSALEVTEAFCHRAALAHQLVRLHKHAQTMQKPSQRITPSKTQL
jgi:preprotein translocase subunit SecD